MFSVGLFVPKGYKMENRIGYNNLSSKIKMIKHGTILI